MEKLLFITPELPFPPHSGGKLKSLKLLHALAERYEITLACPLKGDDAAHLKAFHAVSPCARHLHASLDVPRSASSLVASYARSWPLNVHRTFHRELASQIDAIAGQFDVILMDHYEVFSYLPDAFEGLTIYHAHNAYHKIWARYASLPGNPAVRAAAWAEARRVRSYEARVARKSDLVFAAPNDAAELMACGVDGSNIRDTYHLGDDRQLDLPDLQFLHTAKKLMYVGSLGWEPNAQGLLWFIREVWPQLLTRHPDLEFDIVGKGASEDLRTAVEHQPGIRLRGFVDDLQVIYRECRVSVAPLQFGSGMKVKVLDAMARGMPTVTTAVGAEGIAAEHGHHLMISRDAVSMAEHVSLLLDDQALWDRLQVKSRDLVRKHYTWQQLFNNMHREIRLALEDFTIVPDSEVNSGLSHVS